MKKYLIAILIVLIVIDALIIGALVYINSKNKGDEVNLLANEDRAFSDEKKDTKGEIFSDVITEYIVDEIWKPTADNKTTTVNILKRIKDDKMYVNVIPDLSELQVYYIMKNTNNGYGVFSCVKVTKPLSEAEKVKEEEQYRFYIKDNRVIAVTNFKRNVWYEPRDKCELTGQFLSNVEKAYKYYINYDPAIN